MLQNSVITDNKAVKVKVHRKYVLFTRTNHATDEFSSVSPSVKRSGQLTCEEAIP